MYVYVGLNCLKNLCLSLVSGVPPLFFSTTPLVSCVGTGRLVVKPPHLDRVSRVSRHLSAGQQQQLGRLAMSLLHAPLPTTALTQQTTTIPNQPSHRRAGTHAGRVEALLINDNRISV